MILNVGKTPFVDFKFDEKYRIVDKYIHSQISHNYMNYKPPMATVTEFIKRINEEQILYSFDEKDYLMYQEVIKLFSSNPSTEELHKYYLKTVSKLIAFGNKESVIKNELSKKIDVKYSENIILEASESKYVFPEKVVVFNDEFRCSEYYKTLINGKYLKIANDKVLSNVYQENMTRKEIAEKTNLSASTVSRFLKENDISTTGNKQMKTIELISEFRKNYPSATQTQCQEITSMKLPTIKRYWKKSTPSI